MGVPAAGRPIVVGVDGSESAVQATCWAAREAARHRTTLRLVSADPSTVVGPPPAPDDRRALRRLARVRVAAAAAAATDEVPDVVVEQQVRHDHPIPVLLGESQHADLLVVGNRGLGGFTALLLGSVSIGVTARAACPVVVVRGSGPGAPVPTDGSVVVGVDGSPTSEAALAFAFEAAAARRVPLLAVHVWRDTLVEPTMAPIYAWDQIEEDETEVLLQRLAGWGTDYPDVEVIRLVARDLPARVLVEHSAKAQLMVVGTRGRGGMSGLVLGSVSQAVLHHATCPVAVVRDVRARTWWGGDARWVRPM
jgi:nucleotide-binding universal stress UspA family protein